MKNFFWNSNFPKLAYLKCWLVGGRCALIVCTCVRMCMSMCKRVVSIVRALKIKWNTHAHTPKTSKECGRSLNHIVAFMMKNPSCSSRPFSFTRCLSFSFITSPTVSFRSVPFRTIIQPEYTFSGICVKVKNYINKLNTESLLTTKRRTSKTDLWNSFREKQSANANAEA